MTEPALSQQPESIGVFRGAGLERDSDTFESESPKIFVAPDRGICESCRRDMEDPADRRYRYPFTCCGHCGPGYTLTHSLPYSRNTTSMSGFELCADCESEYSDPLNPRYRSEPLACPTCGPRLSLEPDCTGRSIYDEAAIASVVDALRAGKIIALKGTGGYQLACDATDSAAVNELRRRVHRPDKPLAVMFPFAGSDGLDRVRHHARLVQGDGELLSSSLRPIVLLTRRPSSTLADRVAPGLRELGACLPDSALHHLVLTDFGGPLIMTSDTTNGGPAMIENGEASRRLVRVADVLLHHDRPIVRPVDAPVYRRVAGCSRPLRIGTGAAPVDIYLPWRQPRPAIATGANKGGAIALSWDDRAVVWPRSGEVPNAGSFDALDRASRDLQNIYGVEARAVICDAHSGYATSQWAQRQRGLQVETVWHHEAHASAVAAEFALPGRWLVFAWDGVGLGEDGTLWGGEAYLGSAGRWRRVCSFRPFRLPDAARVHREPWRSAAALHWECGRKWAQSPDKDGLAEVAWRRGLNTPKTSAVGRLFDAAAAMICGEMRSGYEALGAMRLESLARSPRNPVYLSLSRGSNGVLCSDWEPLLEVLTDDGRSPQERSEIFHATVAQVIVQQACRLRYEHNIDQVGLSGGVFQNRILTELAIEGLTRRGFRICMPERLPCNDTALSLGQAAHVAARASLDAGA